MRNRTNSPEGKARDKAWRLANPEKVKAKAQRKYERHGARDNEKKKKFFAENPDKYLAHLASNCIRRSQNRDRYNAKSAEWHLKNPERVVRVRQAYREAHREEARLKTQKWREDFREKNAEAIFQKKLQREAEKVEFKKGQKERQKVWGKEYRARTADRIKANKAVWNSANKDRIRAAHRQWANSSYGKSFYSNKGSRHRVARVNGPQGKIPDKAFIEWKAQFPVCYYCDSPPGKFPLEVDHVMPVILGGHHTLGNLVMACKKCNSAKRDMNPFDWWR